MELHLNSICDISLMKYITPWIIFASLFGIYRIVNYSVKRRLYKLTKNILNIKELDSVLDQNIDKHTYSFVKDVPERYFRYKVYFWYMISPKQFLLKISINPEYGEICKEYSFFIIKIYDIPFCDRCRIFYNIIFNKKTDLSPTAIRTICETIENDSKFIDKIKLKEVSEIGGKT